MNVNNPNCLVKKILEMGIVASNNAAHFMSEPTSHLRVFHGCSKCYFFLSKISMASTAMFSKPQKSPSLKTVVSPFFAMWAA